MQGFGVWFFVLMCNGPFSAAQGSGFQVWFKGELEGQGSRGAGAWVSRPWGRSAGV